MKRLPIYAEGDISASEFNNIQILGLVRVVVFVCNGSNYERVYSIV